MLRLIEQPVSEDGSQMSREERRRQARRGARHRAQSRARAVRSRLRNWGFLAAMVAATLAVIDRRVAASTVDVVVVEAIKLIEAGMADGCDSVWVTTCRPDQQLARIMSVRNLSRAEAEQRVRAQPPQEEKIARADVVIDTSGTLAQTREQVREAWKRLAAETTGKAILGV